MASNLLRLASKDLLQNVARCKAVQPCATYYGKKRIGDRDIVGFGVNGAYSYEDLLDFPYPSIRFAANTKDVMALRAKETGDWKKLTMDEKKTLYRASFCQTFAEINAPTGDWKSITAGVLGLLAASLCWAIFMKKFVSLPLRKGLTPEGKQEILEKLIAMEISPIHGVASKWDYDNNRWKD